MKRYSHAATQLIFRELSDQGRSQTWLAERLRGWEPELSMRVWDSRLSAMKAGRLAMPDDVVEVCCKLLGISDSVLSFFVLVSLPSDKSVIESAA